MSRKGRKTVRIWNKVICPAIEYTVEGIGLISLLVGMPLLLVLVCG